MSLGATFEQAAASGPILLALGACALAGLVSFASPCVLPLVPGYVSYLAGLVGVSVDGTGAEGAKLRGAGARSRAALGAGLFVLGFSLVFLLETALVFGLADQFALHRETLSRIGGAVTILLALVFLGWPPILGREARLAPRPVAHLGGAPLLGAVFALGWTPCIGPTLGVVVSSALATDGVDAVRGAGLVLAYCLGLGVPFLLVAIGSAAMASATSWLRDHARAVRIVGAATMALIGLLLVTGQWDAVVGQLRSGIGAEYVSPI
ncbi:MAG: cytochrome c biogenesis CcdA family protein [Segniliparus sp.]|uniref:cytochrome c biogenesis CcdA family protein n=1 Tax=Segniliparus sp. TaxID=2804064 RepID=UPI003F3D64F7